MRKDNEIKNVMENTLQNLIPGSRLDKMAGALFGVAVGDALGGTVEFMTREEIRAAYGTLRDIIGGGVWDLQPGETTDDTAMTLCVARGILTNPQNPLPEIAREFVTWMNTNPKDVGNIIRTTLSEGIRQGAKTEEEWQRAAKQGHDLNGGKSAGNGSLMRTIPIALAYYQVNTPDNHIDNNAENKADNSPEGNPDTMRSMALRQSALTHFDPLAGACCALYCDLIRACLLGEPLHQAIEQKMLESKTSDIFIKNHVAFDITLPQTQLKPTGYVIDTLETALACAYQTHSFEDALIRAVNLGGDADTIGAVLGGLVGAAYGYAQIPERWWNKLIQKRECAEVIFRFEQI